MTPRSARPINAKTLGNTADKYASKVRKGKTAKDHAKRSKKEGA